MPKQKTHSGAKKKFKVTGTGKLMRAQPDVGEAHAQVAEAEAPVQ